jgi:hypothetical protein
LRFHQDTIAVGVASAHVELPAPSGGAKGIEGMEAGGPGQNDGADRHGRIGHTQVQELLTNPFGQLGV